MCPLASIAMQQRFLVAGAAIAVGVEHAQLHVGRALAQRAVADGTHGKTVTSGGNQLRIVKCGNGKCDRISKIYLRHRQ